MHTHVYVYIYIHIYVYACIYMTICEIELFRKLYINICMYMCTYIYIHVYIICIYIRCTTIAKVDSLKIIYIYEHTCIYTYIYICMYTYVYIYTYIYIWPSRKLTLKKIYQGKRRKRLLKTWNCSKFSKVRFIVIWHGKLSNELDLENLWERQMKRLLKICNCSNFSKVSFLVTKKKEKETPGNMRLEKKDGDTRKVRILKTGGRDSWEVETQHH